MKKETDEVIIDEFSNGLLIRRPDIYWRLERFLDACAIAAGRKRVPPPPQPPNHFGNPSENPEWRKKMEQRKIRQRKETDDRNKRICYEMATGQLTCGEAIEKMELSGIKSLFSALRRTHDRHSYGEYEQYYVVARDMMNAYVREENRKKKGLPEVVWDGCKFVEVKH